MRDRIERAMAEVHKQVPEGMDLEATLAQCDDLSDELASRGAHIVAMIRAEHEFLIGQGVDPRPYERY
jgi:hypothetical protein